MLYAYEISQQKLNFKHILTYYSGIKFNQVSLYHRVNPPTRLVHDRTSEPSL